MVQGARRLLYARQRLGNRDLKAYKYAYAGGIDVRAHIHGRRGTH